MQGGFTPLLYRLYRSMSLSFICRVLLSNETLRGLTREGRRVDGAYLLWVSSVTNISVANVLQRGRRLCTRYLRRLDAGVRDEASSRKTNKSLCSQERARTLPLHAQKSGTVRERVYTQRPFRTDDYQLSRRCLADSLRFPQYGRRKGQKTRSYICIQAHQAHTRTTPPTIKGPLLLLLSYELRFSGVSFDFILKFTTVLFVRVVLYNIIFQERNFGMDIVETFIAWRIDVPFRSSKHRTQTKIRMVPLCVFLKNFLSKQQ